MMGWKLRAGAAIMVLVAAPMVALAAADTRPTFLDDGYFDVMNVLLPAPIKEEPRGIADREIFKLTRNLKGTPRWALAINDNASDTASLMRDFSCAAGLNLTPQNAPRTAALLEKASRDTARESEAVKAFYRRQRPFQIDQGETCVPESELTGFDYPSGHATRGWTWGLILAEILHDHAATIFTRARAYGESRVVCGAHNASAIEASRLTAESTMTVVRTEQSYADAVVGARAELTALRKISAPPSPSTCAAEEILAEQPIMR
jgi:acid phosphatase (class A)